MLVTEYIGVMEVECHQSWRFVGRHFQLYDTSHKDTELALDMTLVELHYILQVFCARQEDGGGVNRGS